MEISNYPSSADDWAHNLRVAGVILQKSRKATRLPGFTISDLPDIQQELWLHVLKRMSCYDPSRASPETFASRLADNQIASMVRSRRAFKRAGSIPVSSIDELGPAEGGDPASQFIDDASRQRHLCVEHTSHVDRADLRLDIRNVVGSSPAVLRLLAALLNHVPQFAAGEVLGLSRRRTAILVAKLREVFESADLAPDVQNFPSRRM